MKLRNVKNQKFNILNYAIHRKYGILWTDGQVIYLTPFSYVEEFRSALNPSDEKHDAPNSVVLGEFRHVKSVSWSDTDHPHPFLTAAILKQDTSSPAIQFQVWQVIQIFPKVELALILDQFIPQSLARYGFPVWDNNIKKLCLVTKQIARVFYYDSESLKLNQKGDLNPANERDGFQCASWARDSKVLLLATGANIDLYESDPSGIKVVPYLSINVQGTVCAMAITGEAFLCACELLLENLVTKSSKHELPAVEAIHSCKGDCTIDESLKFFQFDVPHASVPEASSCLVILSEEGFILSKINLPCILVPNLLTWLPFRNWCVVGSTNSKLFYVFSLSNSTISQVNEVAIPSYLRPHGIVPTGKCDDSMYVAVGDISTNVHLFPSSRDKGCTRMNIEIVCLSIEALMHKKLRLHKFDNEADFLSASEQSEHSLMNNIKQIMPIKELPQVSLTSPASTADFDFVVEKMSKVLMQRLENKNSLHLYPEASKSELCHNSLRQATVKNSCQTELPVDVSVKHDLYPSLKDIEMVTVHCEYGNGATSKHKETTKEIMLLPGGRLKIATVLEAFDIEHAELFTGYTFCVVSTNMDGCVPVRFHNGDKVWFKGQ